ncbi:MAG: DUF4190 domain-containing protein [Lachnospiraceae bacterium]|nr:DUF4190 domain-containing protein [Lachnospiraceae bacterium]
MDENNVNDVNNSGEYDSQTGDTDSGETDREDIVEQEAYTGEYQVTEAEGSAEVQQYTAEEYENSYYGVEYDDGYTNPERNLTGEKEKDMTLAILSLVFGIIAIFTSPTVFGLGFSVPALVMAIVVLVRRYYGKGLAIAGLVTSVISILTTIAVTVLFVIFGHDLASDLMSTLVDYYYYYSEGGMFDDYGFEDDEYYEDEYYDDEYYDDEYYEEDEYYDEGDDSAEYYEYEEDTTGHVEETPGGAENALFDRSAVTVSSDGTDEVYYDSQEAVPDDTAAEETGIDLDVAIEEENGNF